MKPVLSCVSVTLAVQLVWVILPEVEMVWVKIFPSSGIQGPQMLSSVWGLDSFQVGWQFVLTFDLKRNDGIYRIYHVSQRAGVDVGVMNAAIFSISVFPADGTVMMFAEPACRFSIYDGAEHKTK